LILSPRIQSPWRLISWLLMTIWAVTCAAAPAAAWPEVALPAGVRTFDAGPPMEVNGLPIRVRGFLSPEPPARLADWFRASLGQPLVESRHGASILLGRVEGGYYLTVQIDPAGSGARGLVALSDAAGMLGGGSEARERDTRRQARLPAGMRLLNLVRARDGDRLSEHLVLESDAPLAACQQALTRLLRQEGYTPGRVVVSPAPESAILHFQAPGREAMAVLTHGGERQTSIVLSTAGRGEGLP
jgi:hypothetical protein